MTSHDKFSLFNDIHPTAVIYDNVIMGGGNKIGANAVIGHKEYVRGKKSFSGTVRIGNGNVIGACTLIHAGDVGQTYIGDNNIIMGLVNIGHNVQINDNTEIGAGSVIAGYVTLMDNAKVKIGATIRNRITIGAGAIIGAGAVVVKDCYENLVYLGNPARRKN